MAYFAKHTGFRFIHFVTKDVISFFFIAEWYCIYIIFQEIYCIFFAQSSIDGHLAWFHILVIVNWCAINMGA